MQCKKGIFIKSQGQRVPCGQCMPCRINKGRIWSGRIILENAHFATKTGRHGLFITLTYADEALPLTVEGVPTLAKKRFRIWLANQHAQRNFRYYAVGEYGEKFKRPHYHMAHFSQDPQSAISISETWRKNYGFVSISEITPERARYLANYTAKKLTKPDDARLERGQEPEFRISSRKPPLAHDFVNKLVQRFSTKQGALELAQRGDIRRTFRDPHSNVIYLIAPWILHKAREQLGIPVLHRDRIVANENYLEYHEIQEALWLPEEAKAEEANINAKKTQRLYRSTTVNL